jgi:hypothetical protein
LSPVDRNSPLYFEADIDAENLKKSLGKSEKAYLGFAGSIDETVKSLDDQVTAQEQVAKQSKKVAEEEDRRSNKRSSEHNQRKKHSGVMRGILRREKRSADSLGISLGTLGGLIGGATVLGLIGSAIKSYLAWDRQIRSLNTTMSGTPRLMRTAAAAVQGLTGYLDLSREELLQTAKSMGVIAVQLGNTRQAQKVFKGLFMDVIHLSKSRCSIGFGC